MLGLGGRTVYQGPSQGVLPYFRNLGFHMPRHENPADWFMDVIAGKASAGKGGSGLAIRLQCSHSADSAGVLALCSCTLAHGLRCLPQSLSALPFQTAPGRKPACRFIAVWLSRRMSHADHSPTCGQVGLGYWVLGVLACKRKGLQCLHVRARLSLTGLQALLRGLYLGAGVCVCVLFASAGLDPARKT